MTSISQPINDEWEIDSSLADLYSILSLKRPHESRGEWELIKRYILPIKGINRDDFGNWFLRIGTAPVLWSSHLDTVHQITGPKDIVQKLTIDRQGILAVENGSCLGADCGAGVWLMLRMIEAEIEGLYVFHREEESGGKGSSWIAQVHPEFLKDIDYAIAFDRRGTTSVITHQYYSRCCSDEFAWALASQLGMNFVADPTGVFTDTANYTSLIPECTNISVGYKNEHSYEETLDTVHLKKLLEQIKKIDISKLPVERNCNSPPEYDYSDLPWGQQGRYYGAGSSWYDRDFEDDANEFDSIDRQATTIRNHPYRVATILKEWGILDDVVREIEIGSEF